MDLRVGIRVATDARFGAGHRTRCRALAEALPAPPVVFADPSAPPPWGAPCRLETAPESMSAAIQALRDGEIAALVTDHYAIAESHMAEAASYGPIAAFRDGPPYGPEALTIDLTPGTAGANCLAGPGYAPLTAAYRRPRPGRNLSDTGREGLCLLIAFGARDSANNTERALQAVASHGARLATTVALGDEAPHRSAVSALAHRIGASIVVNAPDMIDLYDTNDLAIGAPGLSQFERAARGLPTLLVAQNQRQVALADRWAAAAVTADRESDAIAGALRSLLDTPARLAAMRDAALRLVDGRGAARLAAALSEWIHGTHEADRDRRAAGTR